MDPFNNTEWISSRLIRWYNAHKRDLPWRHTRDPYRIWISEVILQQTRVEQGLDYYLRFTERFPDVRSLAEAGEEEVLRLWQGLGYYSRARHLHQSARIIVLKHPEGFPSTYPGLIALPGIGEYTAAAILSICFGQPYPVVDGNVIRVISRIWGLREPAGSNAGKKQIRNLASQMMLHHSPGTFNQSLMEFGARLCRPFNPECAVCPLKDHCIAYNEKTVSELPVTKRPPKIITLFIHYLVFHCESQDGKKILLRKRIGSGIWKNLYDFPSLEAPYSLAFGEIEIHPDFVQLLPHGPVRVAEVKEKYRHLLSHRELQVRFFLIGLSGETEIVMADHYRWAGEKDLDNLPFPRLISRFLEKHPLF